MLLCSPPQIDHNPLQVRILPLLPFNNEVTIMSIKTFEMKLVKSTKNKHVYSDVSDAPIVPSVYIEKSGLPSTPPEVITVTLEYEVKS